MTGNNSLRAQQRSTRSGPAKIVGLSKDSVAWECRKTLRHMTSWRDQRTAKVTEADNISMSTHLRDSHKDIIDQFPNSLPIQ